ncbi:MAG: hypothetical protein U1F11_09060 [Steroidobacteraceae bacterium]
MLADTAPRAKDVDEAAALAINSAEETLKGKIDKLEMAGAQAGLPRRSSFRGCSRKHRKLRG